MEVAIVATAATVLGSAYYTKRNSDLQKKSIKQSNEYAAANAANQNKQAQIALAEKKRQNKNLLAQQQASYKANLSAGGVNTKSGSGQTYLNALQREYDMEDKYLDKQAKISSDAILNSLNQTNSSNLLKLNAINNTQESNLYSTLGSLASGMGRTMIK